jgi:hypothetical protein
MSVRLLSFSKEFHFIGHAYFSRVCTVNFSDTMDDFVLVFLYQTLCAEKAAIVKISVAYIANIFD